MVYGPLVQKKTPCDVAACTAEGRPLMDFSFAHLFWFCFCFLIVYLISQFIDLLLFGCSGSQPVCVSKAFLLFVPFPILHGAPKGCCCLVV